MFKQNKWEAWYDSLPQHTKDYIKRQPVWYDRDMYKAFALGALLGFLIGWIM